MTPVAMKKAAFAVATAVLAGCATTVDPPPGARVRIVQNPHVDTLRMRIAELPRPCLPDHLDGAPGRIGLAAGPRGELGLPNPPGGKAVFAERHVAAGRLFVFASEFDPNGTPGKFRSCYVGTAFVPEAGADYELRVELVPGGCEHSVRQFGANGVPDIASPMSHVTWSCPAETPPAAGP